MSATYFCGQRPDLLLADFNANLDEPIVVAGLLKVTKMTVMGSVYRKTEEDAVRVDTELTGAGGAPREESDGRGGVDNVFADQPVSSSASGSAEGDDDQDDETGTDAKMQGDVVGGNGGYFTQGVIVGEVEILGRLEGLTIAAGVWFDTSAGAAEVVAAVQYTMDDLLTLDARARFPLGFCDDVGARMVGTAVVTAAPLAQFAAKASVVRHCEEPLVATERHGHVWLIALDVPHLDAFDGALVGSDISVKVMGRQIGVGDDVGLAWSLEAEGSIGVGVGVTSRLPAALKSVQLSATFRAGVLLRSGKKAENVETSEGSVSDDAVNAAAALLGADSETKINDGTAGLQYFDINATAAIEAGHDPVTGGPIVGMKASLSFSYPCTRPLEVSANAYFHNLGGAKGLTIENIDVALVFFCNAGPEDVQLTFKATVKSVFVGGVNLGSVDIAADAYVRPKRTDLTALGGGGHTSYSSSVAAADAVSPEWYWKGIVNVQASFGTSGVGGTLGAEVFFNTLTNELKAVVNFVLDTEFFTLKMTGEAATYCTESGTFMKGALEVKPGKLPFPLPPILVTASKLCKPYATTVYAFHASLDVDELAGISKTSDQQKISPSSSDEDAAKASIDLKLALPASSNTENVQIIMEAIRTDMTEKGLSGVSAKVHESITMTIVLQGISMTVWDNMESAFRHELAERMACEPEDVGLTPVDLGSDVEVLAEVTNMVQVPFSRADARLGDVRRARLGADYGVTGALSVASQAAGSRPPPFKVSPPQQVKEIRFSGLASSTYTGSLTDHRFEPSPALVRSLATNGVDASDIIAKVSLHRDRVDGTTHAGKQEDGINVGARLGSATIASEWLTFKGLIVELKGRKLAATDASENTNLAWDLDISGGVEFKNTADSPVPSFLPLDLSLDIAFKSSWLGDNLKEQVGRVLARGDASNSKCAAGSNAAAEAEGAGCGASEGGKVCPLGWACLENRCVDPTASYTAGDARNEALANVDEAHSYNADHVCTRDSDVPREESALAIRGQVSWKMDGFSLNVRMGFL